MYRRGCSAAITAAKSPTIARGQSADGTEAKVEFRWALGFKPNCPTPPPQNAQGWVRNKNTSLQGRHKRLRALAARIQRCLNASSGCALGVPSTIPLNPTWCSDCVCGCSGGGCSGDFACQRPRPKSAPRPRKPPPLRRPRPDGLVDAACAVKQRRAIQRKPCCATYGRHLLQEMCSGRSPASNMDMCGPKP